MDWTVSGTILRHVLGIVSDIVTPDWNSADRQALVSLHIWAAMSSYEVLGDFGEHVSAK